MLKYALMKTQFLSMYQLHMQYENVFEEVLNVLTVWHFVYCYGGSIKAKQSECGKEGVKH